MPPRPVDNQRDCCCFPSENDSPRSSCVTKICCIAIPTFVVLAAFFFLTVEAALAITCLTGLGLLLLCGLCCAKRERSPEHRAAEHTRSLHQGPPPAYQPPTTARPSAPVLLDSDRKNDFERTEERKSSAHTGTPVVGMHANRVVPAIVQPIPQPTPVNLVIAIPPNVPLVPASRTIVERRQPPLESKQSSPSYTSVVQGSQRSAGNEPVGYRTANPPPQSLPVLPRSFRTEKKGNPVSTVSTASCPIPRPSQHEPVGRRAGNPSPQTERKRNQASAIFTVSHPVPRSSEHEPVGARGRRRLEEGKG
ncbi:MAG: hypothetical protein KGJ02_05720 [Verrucomicrobiota bacterium]|nr:hypothetical protein [Verrucomicrobiota bacterium]